MPCMTPTEVGDLLSGIGALLAGVAALGALRKGSAALDGWRTQRRDAMRAAAASKVAEASFRMIEALRDVRAPYGAAAPTSPDDSGKQYGDVEARWRGIKHVTDAFIDAFPTARAYLPSEVLDELTQLRKLVDAIHGAHTFLTMRSLSEPAIRKRNFEIAHGNDGKDQTSRRIYDSEQRLMALLRPLAALDVPKSDPAPTEPVE